MITRRTASAAWTPPKQLCLQAVFVLGLALGTTPLSPALAQRDLKHIPDPDPHAQRESFRVAEDFEVNLFASDPMIAKPVQINWDARGRLWIVSSKVYPQIEPGQEAQDEILVLEDTDGDGTADKKTVFADGLLIPTGVLPTDGGAYVANSTELLFLEDTDEDGRADRREILLSGFGTEDTHHIIHTFRGGPEGMVYFNQSIYIHSHVETPWGVRRLMGGGLWHFRPETRELKVFCKGFVNPWGHVFDRWGQSFATDGAYGEGVNYVFPGSVFFSSPGAKRILKGLKPGQPKQCGMAVLSGRHLPEAWRRHIVTNDFRGHRVNRFSLQEEGSGYQARQQPDLLWTTHAAFRPIAVEMGPDGAIYVADWYNPIIQHGEVDFRDERRDQTHGRIWRLTAKGRPLVEWPDIPEATIPDLLDLLRTPEDLTRYHAKQELRSRPADEVLATLNRWVQDLQPADPLYEHLRLEALWVYQALNRLEPALLREILRSNDHRARAAAVRVLYHWPHRLPDALERLDEAIRDSHPQVRLEAVNALRSHGTLKAFQKAMLALESPMDENLDFALWLTARELEDLWLPALQAGSFRFEANAARLFALRAIENPEALRPLIATLTSTDAPDPEVTEVLNLIRDLGSPEDLGETYRIALEKPLALKTEMLQAILAATEQRDVVPQGDLGETGSYLDHNDESLRALACRAVGHWKLEAHRPALEAVAQAADTPAPVYEAALDGLQAWGSSSVPLLAALSASPDHTLDQRLQAATRLAPLDLREGLRQMVSLLESAEEDSPVLQEAWTRFLSLAEGPQALADALEQKRLARPVAYAGLQKASGAGDRGVPLVQALTRAGDLSSVDQDLTQEEMAALMEEVASQGDPHRGEFIYRREELQCTVCHALGGAGGNLGPDMISLGASAPVDYIIESLLSPNRKIKEGYHMTTVYTEDDQVLSGFIAREDERQLVLRDATGQETPIQQSQVVKKEIAPISMMPPGLTASLRRDEFIHLVRFLSELGKEGSFKVPPRRLVRRWRVLNFTPEIDEPVRKGDQRFYALDDDAKEWLPAYSTVRGVLPVSAIPSAQRWLYLVAPVRFEVDVTVPGEIAIQFNSTEGMRAWIGETEVPLEADRLTKQLDSGRHTVTLVLDRNAFPKPTLEAELIDVPGSPASVQLVNDI